MIYLLFSLLLIVAVVVTYFVTKKKAFNKGYHHGELVGKESSKDKIPYTVYDFKNLVHRGIDPISGIEIFEKEHNCEKNIVPYFGIRIKYNKNDKKPNERFYNINVYHGRYGDNQINITPEGISDGYHTFDELYYYRLCYNAALINTLVKLIKENPAKFKDIKVCKSKKHFGGEPCYDGSWFIVMISTPWGQISNHYKLEYWDMFNCPINKQSWKWDGHGMKEAMERLNRLSKFIATGSSL